MVCYGLKFLKTNIAVQFRTYTSKFTFFLFFIYKGFQFFPHLVPHFCSCFSWELRTSWLFLTRNPKQMGNMRHTYSMSGARTPQTNTSTGAQLGNSHRVFYITRETRHHTLLPTLMKRLNLLFLPLLCKFAIFYPKIV